MNDLQNLPEHAKQAITNLIDQGVVDRGSTVDEVMFALHQRGEYTAVSEIGYARHGYYDRVDTGEREDER